MSEALIEIRGLTNRFGEQVVHDRLDMDIRQGEILGLVGGSGSGKSVLMNTILGLNTPAEGQITMAGRNLLNRDERKAVLPKWGIMFQNGALYSSLNVRENIMFPMREHTDMPEWLQREMADLRLQMVGLPVETAYKSPSELSGGMVKRVALARAIALDPLVLFLDEPTAGLDPVGADAFDSLILSLRDTLHLTVVMITHDLDSLFGICDRIAALVDKKAVTGTLEEMLASEHPWMRAYFHGARSRAARETNEATDGTSG